MDVLDPNQLAAEAKEAYQDGNFLEAAQFFQGAEESYRLSGDILNAAEMANNRSVSLLQAGDAEAALQAVTWTVEVFEKTNDIRRLALALGNKAAALEGCKQFDIAITHYQKSADLFLQIGDNELYISTMQSLSALQLRTGRQLEALATMQSGLNKIDRPGLKNRFLKKILDIPFRLLNRS